MKARTLALISVVVALLAVFVFVNFRSGPFAAIQVTVASVEKRAIAPALFGIGTVEAQYTYKIGPTVASRVKHIAVQVGDLIHAGQVLGEMDPVDLDDRINAQKANRQRVASAVQAAEAQVQDGIARLQHADAQLQRYQKLLTTHAISQETVDIKRQEQRIAQAGLAADRANLDVVHRDLARVEADVKGAIQQRTNQQLIAPADGLVVARDADPGTTLVAGQAVLIVIDPNSLWINARFDQLRASGLRAGLPVRIALRSQAEQTFAGRVLRLEPLADAVTEETLAKVVFDDIPDPLPLVGELAEVTVALPTRTAVPVINKASVQRIDNRLGVWRVEDGELRFAPVTLGAEDLEGSVEILTGLNPGDQVVVYSERALNTRSRIAIVEQLAGVSP